MSDRDQLYAQPLPKVSDFVFDEQVARVFPDMIKRSVPGYPTIMENTGLIAGQYALGGSLIYDLGCSLGAATQAIRRHVLVDGCKVMAVDNAAAMVERCREYLSAQDAMVEELLPVEVIEADILQLPLQPCSVVVLNFTLQFIDPGRRQELLKRIHDALLPGGVLILSEKLQFSDDHAADELQKLHFAFKRANGYSELEIAQKRTAIEKVMLPDTLETHLQRLQAVGFRHCHQWFQCLNFASLVAFK